MPPDNSPTSLSIDEVLIEYFLKPGALFFAGEKTNYIYPDIIIQQTNNNFNIRIGEREFPGIHISAFYRELLNNSDDKELRDYISEKIRQAKWLVNSIERRQSMLRRCVQAILESQKEFFNGLATNLAPLSMLDIANRIGVHESTISRAVKGKYLQCTHGIYPLNYFFSRKIGEKDTSADKIKHLIYEIIKMENSSAPVSDQAITEDLKAQGIEIARRTVAKYRVNMNIPNTMGRK